MHHLRWALSEVVDAVMGKLLDLRVDAVQAGFEGALVQVSEIVMLTPD